MRNAEAEGVRQLGRNGLGPLLRALALAAVAAWSAAFLFGVLDQYRHVQPDRYAMFWDRRAWLWAHLAGGALTLVLGPVQFLTQWPRAYGRLHRWTGRVFITGMLIAATGATGLIATSPAPFSIRLAFAATAWAWLLAALTGLVLIRRGQVTRHRTWMIRAYLVTLAPVTFRLLLHWPPVFTVVPQPPTGIAWLLWLSWLVPVAVYELGRRAVAIVSPVRASSTSP